MSKEKRTASVIIIGGGIVGCATAYNLAKRGVKDIIVLEQKEIGNGGSCRNAGGVRQSARDVRELPLAMYAVSNIWPTLGEELGVDVEYVQKGNLRLGLNDAHLKTLEGHVKKSTDVGLDVWMVSGDEAREICPAMSERVVGASWCPTDGHANPLKATLGFYLKALSMGVTFVTGVTVAGIRKVRGAGGEFYGHQSEHGSFVLGGNSGIEAYTSDTRTRFNTDSITASSISRGILMYFPALSDVKIVRTWAGWYDACSDVVPILDSIGEVPGLTLACGFSGHGFGISPAVGLALSELILDGESHTIDISALKYDRFKAKG